MLRFRQHDMPEAVSRQPGGNANMTQRRRIAIAYLFAVPTVLGVVLSQHVAFVRVKRSEAGMSHASEALRECNVALSLLNEAEAEAQRYVSAGHQESRNLFLNDVARLHTVLPRLRNLSDSSAQSQLTSLELLVLKRIGFLQQMIDRNDRAPQNRTGLNAGKPSDDFGKLIEEIKTAQQTRLDQQSEAADQSLRFANGVNTFGGFLMIWLVGVAALLLFHDEKRRAWSGMERRVHTRVLETLPLGVSLSTEAGAIVYANHAEEAAFGYDEGELIGQNVKRLHVCGNDGTEPDTEEIIDRLGHAETWSGELTIRKKDGSTARTAAWIMNMGVSGKFYRMFVHDQDRQHEAREETRLSKETALAGH
jgi:PAS domain S-box-containing protein